MTHLIHIVGPQGVGKTRLALDIIAGLEKRGKTALSLVEAGFQLGGEFTTAKSIDALRLIPICLPHPRSMPCFYDYLIVEHQHRPKALQLQPGDRLMTIEVAA